MRPPDWAVDPDALRAAVTPRTRMLLLNSPHNPTGKVFSRAELEPVATVCREHDLVAVADEVYEHRSSRASTCHPRRCRGWPSAR